eukprot:TRINITY_DN67661_c6_g3_i4.p1 TRINITY_DN67661_c6_g3~~TRINITY_DN67661_c6_g3_i4.p1  ORF type:complete len:436 (-),score=12.11 TRINITY_DN67661_c6_g3_i4:274-1581(-)
MGCTSSKDKVDEPPTENCTTTRATDACAAVTMGALGESGVIDALEKCLRHGKDLNEFGFATAWDRTPVTGLPQYKHLLHLGLDDYCPTITVLPVGFVRRETNTTEGSGQVWELKHSTNNARDIQPGTPLHFAVQSGQVEVVRWLLEHGVRTDLQLIPKDSASTAFHLIPDDTQTGPILRSLFRQEEAYHLEELCLKVHTGEGTSSTDSEEDVLSAKFPLDDDCCSSSAGSPKQAVSRSLCAGSIFPPWTVQDSVQRLTDNPICTAAWDGSLRVSDYSVTELNEVRGFARVTEPNNRGWSAVVGINAMQGCVAHVRHFGRPGNALHWAMIGANVELVDELLSYGVDPTEPLFEVQGLEVRPVNILVAKAEIEAALFAALQRHAETSRKQRRKTLAAMATGKGPVAGCDIDPAPGVSVCIDGYLETAVTYTLVNSKA